MLFKEIFDKEFITEEKIKKSLKIIYELKLELYKKESEIPQEPVAYIPQPEVQPQQAPQPEIQTEPVQQMPDMNTQQPEVQPQANSQVLPTASIVTEDEVSINDDNRIFRKFEGEVTLTDSQKDNIQSLDDIISVLSEHKKDGENILDEFSTEIIQLLYSQNNQELSQKIDKKSNIFVEIYYGYKKDDSVGVRFIKRKNSDTLTSSMLVDNEIISAPFNITRVDQKISEIRNYEVKK